MSWLKSLAKVPGKYDAAYLKLLIERIRTAVNFIDDTNFPKGIEGSWINDGTIVSKKLGSTMWYLPILALREGTYTANTEAVTISGFIPWSTAWGSNVKIRLEATITSTNESAVCTVTLEGAGGTLITLTSSKGAWELKQSDFIPAPLASQTMVLKMKTSNAGYNAGILHAMLTIVPNN